MNPGVERRRIIVLDRVALNRDQIDGNTLF